MKRRAASTFALLPILTLTPSARAQFRMLPQPQIQRAQGPEVTQDEQTEYESIQNRSSRLHNQVVETNLCLDQNVAAFIDRYCGNADWCTTKSEFAQFEADSEGKDKFYVPVLSPEKVNSILLTSNPFDYEQATFNLPIDNRLVFATQREIEKRIHSDTDLAYIEVHKSTENSPYTHPFVVTALYEYSNTGKFERQSVHNFKLAEAETITQPERCVELGSLVHKRGMQYYSVNDRNSLIQVGIPLGNSLENLLVRDTTFYALYSSNENADAGKPKHYELFMGNPGYMIPLNIKDVETTKDETIVTYEQSWQTGVLHVPRAGWDIFFSTRGKTYITWGGKNYYCTELEAQKLEP